MPVAVALALRLLAVSSQGGSPSTTQSQAQLAFERCPAHAAQHNFWGSLGQSETQTETERWKRWERWEMVERGRERGASA